MGYFFSLTVAALISLSALEVQALLYPREAGLPRLPSRATLEHVYERHFDRLQARNLQSLYERDRDTLYQRDHGLVNQRSAGTIDERGTYTLSDRDLHIRSQDLDHNAHTILHARSGGDRARLTRPPESAFSFARPRPEEAPLPRASPGGTPLARAGSDGNVPPNLNMAIAFGSETELTDSSSGSATPLLRGTHHRPPGKSYPPTTGPPHEANTPIGTSSQDPHPAGGHIEVRMGQTDFLSYNGPETYISSGGFLGCIGVVAKGAPGTGAVIAHIVPGKMDTIRHMWILLMQKNIHKEAKIYAPARNGEIMNSAGQEMTAIKHALRASGIWNAQVIPYPISESRPGGYTLSVDIHGIDTWYANTRSPRVLSPPKARMPEPASNMPMPASSITMFQSADAPRPEPPPREAPSAPSFRPASEQRLIPSGGSSSDSPTSPPVYGPEPYVPFGPAPNGLGASGPSTPRFGSPIRGQSVPSLPRSPPK